MQPPSQTECVCCSLLCTEAARRMIKILSTAYMHACVPIKLEGNAACLVVKPPIRPPTMPAMNKDDVNSCRPWLLYLQNPNQQIVTQW